MTSIMKHPTDKLDIVNDVTCVCQSVTSLLLNIESFTNETRLYKGKMKREREEK